MFSFFRKPGEQDGEVLTTESDNFLSTRSIEELVAEDKTSTIYEKHDALLHGKSRSKRDKIFTLQFMKKFIHLAKQFKPVLTNEAAEMISEEYSKLRSEDQMELDTARVSNLFSARTSEKFTRIMTWFCMLK